jgi:predicted nucleic acid-binding protein
VLIVDANVIVAVMNRRDKNHARMKALLEGRDDQFVVTGYVVAEVAYLVQKFAGPAAEIQFMEAVRDGAFQALRGSRETVFDRLPTAGEL